MSFLIRCLRQFLTALWVLLGLYCVCEVMVRLYDARTGQVTRNAEGEGGLVVKSWATHHGLKPLQNVVRKGEGGRQISIRTNSRGLRGAEPMIPKPEGVYRIICMGDERVFGPHMEESETFPSRIERLLQHWMQKSGSNRRVEVINAGVPDYCPLLSFLQFEHALTALQPDMVLLNFDMSDVSDDYRYRRHVTFDEEGHPRCCIHPGLEIRKLSGNALVNEVLLIPRWGRQKLIESWTSRMFSMPQSNISSSTCKYLWLDDHCPDWGVHIRQALEPVEELHQQCVENHIEMVLLMAPAPFQVSDEACGDPELRSRVGVGPHKLFSSEHPFDLVFSFCKDHGIPLCDAVGAFLDCERGEELFLRQSVELSAEGHSLLARTAAVYLVKHFPRVWSGEGDSPGGSGGDRTERGGLTGGEFRKPIRDSEVRSASNGVLHAMGGDR